MGRRSARNLTASCAAARFRVRKQLPGWKVAGHHRPGDSWTRPVLRQCQLLTVTGRQQSQLLQLVVRQQHTHLPGTDVLAQELPQHRHQPVRHRLVHHRQQPPGSSLSPNAQPSPSRSPKSRAVRRLVCYLVLINALPPLAALHTSRSALIRFGQRVRRHLVSGVCTTAPPRSIRIAVSFETASTRQGWTPSRRTTGLPGTGRCPYTPAVDTTSSAVLTAASASPRRPLPAPPG